MSWIIAESMTDAKSNEAAIIAIGASLTAAAIAFSWKKQQQRTTEKSKSKDPPFVPDGFFKCVSTFTSPFGFMPIHTGWAKDLNFPSAMSLPIIPGSKCAMVVDPELQSEIFKDKLTIKPKSLYRAFESVRGSSMLCDMNDVTWKRRRKGVLPAFHPDNLGRMEKVCSQLAETWEEEVLKKGQPFDPAEEMVSFTVAIIIKAAYDYDPTPDEIRTLLDDMDTMMRETNLRMFNPLREWLQVLLPGVRRANAASRRTRALCQKFIDNYRASPNPTAGTVLDCIMKNSFYQNDTERCAEVDIVLLGGHETTGYSLAWMLFMAAKHPEAAEKVRVALLNTSADSCVELQNFVRESLRLNPVAPSGAIRATGRDFDTRDGYRVSKGTVCFLSQILPSISPHIFGLDAHEFRPDRWIGASDGMKAAVAPFALGPRNCVGRSLANIELNSVMAMVLSRYRLELVQDYKAEYYVTYHPIEGLLKATKVD